MLIVSILLTALLFGGMVLFSFGVAAFLIAVLPPNIANRTIRQAFPHFYLFVMVSSAAAAAALWVSSLPGAGLLALVTGTVLPTRQILMPAINRATDTGAKGRFKVLHGLSVVITLAHIALTGMVLAGLAGAA